MAKNDKMIRSEMKRNLSEMLRNLSEMIRNLSEMLSYQK